MQKGLYHLICSGIIPNFIKITKMKRRKKTILIIFFTLLFLGLVLIKIFSRILSFKNLNTIYYNASRFSKVYDVINRNIILWIIKTSIANSNGKLFIPTVLPGKYCDKLKLEKIIYFPKE